VKISSSRHTSLSIDESLRHGSTSTASGKSFSRPSTQHRVSIGGSYSATASSNSSPPSVDSNLSDHEKNTDGPIFVVARLSSHTVRTEREYNLSHQLIQTVDPEAKHFAKPIALHRLLPHPKDTGPVSAAIYESPGRNHLKELVNFGPASDMNFVEDMPFIKDPSVVDAGKRSYFGRDPVPIPLFLDFAIGATEALEILHYSGHVHGEIRGDAFHYHQGDNVTKLINYGVGARSFEHGLTSAGWASFTQEIGINTKLQFISPEQTGRMQARPDSRSDIYGLGILFFTMLTRTPAIDGSQPMEIITNLLAKRIPAVSSRRLDVPECISQIVRKMTMKQIDERYHSMSGLKHDLQQIQKMIGENDKEGLKAFEPAKFDNKSYFLLPSTMVGRTAEHDKLVSVIRKVGKRYTSASVNKKGLYSISSNSSISEDKMESFGDTLSSQDTVSESGGGLDTDSRAHSTAHSGSHGMTVIDEGKPHILAQRTSNANMLSVESAESVASNFGSKQGTSSKNSMPSLDGYPQGSHEMEKLRHPASSSNLTRRRVGQRKYQRKGHCELVIISGSAGLGKSSLVQSIQQESRKFGLFSSAKFDQTKNTPYGPVLRLMSSLFKQVFSESETDFHTSLRTQIRPHWHLLYELLDLPAHLLDASTQKPTNKFLNRDLQRNRSLNISKERRSSTPNSSQSSVQHPFTHPSSDGMRGASQTKSLRFINNFIEVLRIFAQSKLIVLCLDDLQFADEESLELLDHIIASKIGIVMIVTIRPSEVLQSKVNTVLHSEYASITKIPLTALTEDNVLDYVSSTLHLSREKVIPLTAVLLQKTVGNPFMIREMLDTMHRKACIYYDWKTSSWMYDLDRIFKEFEQPGSHDQVLSNDFIAQRLLELSPETRSVLAWGSLLGTTFSFKLVERLLSSEFDFDEEEADARPICPLMDKCHKHREADTIRGLQGALQSVVLLPTDDDDEYRFAHDRYVQAAAALRETRNVPKMHLIVAEVMMKYHGLDERDIYTRADHVCKAVNLIKTRHSHRVRFRALLISAATKASDNGAHHAALNYYRHTAMLMHTNRWEDKPENDTYYEETLKIYREMATCHWYLGQFTEALIPLQATFDHAHNDIDKAESWVLQSRLFFQHRDLHGALSSLKICLRSLGVVIEEEKTWEQCDTEFQTIVKRLRSIDRTNFTDEQQVSDDNVELTTVAMVLNELMVTAFFSDPLLFFQMAMKLVLLHLDGGSFPQAGLGYILLAIVVSGRFEMVQLASEMGEMGLAMSENSTDPLISGRSIAIHSWFVQHLTQHARNCIPALEMAIEESGAVDKVFMVLCVANIAIYKLYCSDDLRDIEAYCTSAIAEFATFVENSDSGAMLISVHQVAKALMGQTNVESADEIMTDHTHNSRAYAESIELQSSHVNSSLMFYWSHSLAPLYLYGHYERAIEIGDRCTAVLNQQLSSRRTRFMLFYLSLSKLAMLRRHPDGENRQEVLDAVQENIRLIKAWEAVNSVNYLMWSELLKAEKYEIVSDHDRSIRAYEIALDHSQRHGFMLEEALCFELQGMFFIRRGARRAARDALKDSISVYTQMGAVGKARQVAEKNDDLLSSYSQLRVADMGCQTDFVGNGGPAPNQFANHHQVELGRDISEAEERTMAWLSPPVKSDTPTQGNEPNVHVPGLSSSTNLDMIDLSGILTSNQLLASEVDLEQLLTKMCQIILDSSGGQADFVAIAIEDEEVGWSIAANGDSENGVTPLPTKIQFEKIENEVSVAVIRYAIRFRDTVFLPNIVEDERFSNVPELWLQRNASGKSVIALPIIHRDVLVGICYLEGQPHSFTDRNLTVLQLLTNQMGISMTNSRLFSKIVRVQNANLQMIESQKKHLKQAREAEAREKKAKDEALTSMREKEKAAKAKDMFLANISHELRTPLNGVIGMSELLKGTQMTEEQEECADSIRLAADQLLTVINDILDYSKLEANKMAMFNVAFNLHDSIREVVRTVGLSNHDKAHLTLESTINIPLKQLVIGDPLRLRQIFMNILSNSYKFTNQGGITVNATTDFENDKELQMTCSVADTGIGIPHELHKKLFLPFSQADASTARQFGGSGLGLSICKSLIEVNMGGHIWLRSEPGVGTTAYFTIRFPKAEKDAMANKNDVIAREADPMAIYSPPAGEHESKSYMHPHIDLSRVPRDKIRICLAEDNPLNAKIGVGLLKKLNFTADVAVNGQEAVDALHKKALMGDPYHLVLMDVQMPVLDGYDATKAIRASANPTVRSVV
jgi:signal transduction histidine kinase/predicted ATPase/serine/threonine protein kinase